MIVKLKITLYLNIYLFKINNVTKHKTSPINTNPTEYINFMYLSS